MKLQNKKTGKITNSKEVLTDEFIKDLYSKDFNYFMSKLDKLQEEWEVQEEWEDVPEEPKGYWFIDSLGEVHKHVKDSQMLDIEQTAIEDWHLSIGNHFETEKEAEKAAEKLRAYNRLKDRGFRFEGKTFEYKSNKHFGSVFFETSEDILDIYDDNVEFYDDIDLLFGGEE